MSLIIILKVLLIIAAFFAYSTYQIIGIAFIIEYSAETTFNINYPDSKLREYILVSFIGSLLNLSSFSWYYDIQAKLYKYLILFLIIFNSALAIWGSNELFVKSAIISRNPVRKLDFWEYGRINFIMQITCTIIYGSMILYFMRPFKKPNIFNKDNISYGTVEESGITLTREPVTVISTP